MAYPDQQKDVSLDNSHLIFIFQKLFYYASDLTEICSSKMKTNQATGEINLLETKITKDEVEAMISK